MKKERAVCSPSALLLLVCEGIVNQSWLALNYHHKRDYETQLTAFCCEHYKRCEVYNMIMRYKYDEDWG